MLTCRRWTAASASCQLQETRPQLDIGRCSSCLTEIRSCSNALTRRSSGSVCSERSFGNIKEKIGAAPHAGVAFPHQHAL